MLTFSQGRVNTPLQHNSRQCLVSPPPLLCPRRIVLVCAKRSLYAAFSVLPYGDSSSQLRYMTILTVPSFSFMICHLVFIRRHRVRVASRRPRLILCDSPIFCLKQRPEAGGPETEAVVRGGHRPPALSGGHGAGLLREGKLSAWSRAQDQDGRLWVGGREGVVLSIFPWTQWQIMH